MKNTIKTCNLYNAIICSSMLMFIMWAVGLKLELELDININVNIYKLKLMVRTRLKMLRNGANLNFQTVIYVTVMLMAFLSNF